MNRSRHPKFGFASHEGLMLIAVAGISLGLFFPAVRHSMETGFSGWLSTLLGLGLVALFWLAFTTVAMVIVRIALWIEEEWQW